MVHLVDAFGGVSFLLDVSFADFIEKKTAPSTDSSFEATFRPASSWSQTEVIAFYSKR